MRGIFLGELFLLLSGILELLKIFSPILSARFASTTPTHIHRSYNIWRADKQAGWQTGVNGLKHRFKPSRWFLRASQIELT